MKILFLDMDGVLNSYQHFLMTENDESMFDDDLEFFCQALCAHNIWNLNFILEKVPELKIVISSAWANYLKLQSFKDLLKEFNINPDRIIDITPRKLSSSRGNEIQWWLDNHQSHESAEVSYAILDDNDDAISAFHAKQFIHTDCHVGLTIVDAFKVIKLLEPTYQLPIVMM